MVTCMFLQSRTSCFHWLTRQLALLRMSRLVLLLIFTMLTSLPTLICFRSSTVRGHLASTTRISFFLDMNLTKNTTVKVCSGKHYILISYLPRDFPQFLSGIWVQWRPLPWVEAASWGIHFEADYSKFPLGEKVTVKVYSESTSLSKCVLWQGECYSIARLSNQKRRSLTSDVSA